jgi:hypothetical protein
MKSIRVFEEWQLCAVVAIGDDEGMIGGLRAPQRSSCHVVVAVLSWRWKLPMEGRPKCLFRGGKGPNSKALTERHRLATNMST